jgi:hypothetical protein
MSPTYRYLTALAAILLIGLPPAAAQTTETGTVNIVNQRDTAIFVGSSGTGAIEWQLSQPACTAIDGGVRIGVGKSCSATVVATNRDSRFCATKASSAPAQQAQAPDCLHAQDNHQTLIELTFSTSNHCAFLNAKGTCIWYDVSVIPVGCDNKDWKSDMCAKEGRGASYNFPVELSCPADTVTHTTFTCQGPRTAKFGAQNYPLHCGNPLASCVGNLQRCVQAFFWPMSGEPINPNVPCRGGQLLTVTFLPGP